MISRLVIECDVEHDDDLSIDYIVAATGSNVIEAALLGKTLLSRQSGDVNAYIITARPIRHLRTNGS